jgi:hypothetical protein
VFKPLPGGETNRLSILRQAWPVPAGICQSDFKAASSPLIRKNVCCKRRVKSLVDRSTSFRFGQTGGKRRFHPFPRCIKHPDSDQEPFFHAHVRIQLTLAPLEISRPLSATALTGTSMLIARIDMVSRYGKKPYLSPVEGRKKRAVSPEDN